MQTCSIIRTFALATVVLVCGPWYSWAAGVTVIIHGWQPGMTGEPVWLSGMQNAISTEGLGGEENFGTITVTESLGVLSAACSPWNVDLAASTTGEIVIRVNWSAVANHQLNGITAQEVAAVVAPRIHLAQGASRSLAELPIHLIGHSRGGGMVCEIARLLGEEGIDVDHLTPLDPHPLGSSGADPPGPTGPVVDTPVAVYENVLFADNYWQDINYPEGVELNGAVNRKWDFASGGIPGGYQEIGAGTISEHLNIHLAYHGTIDLATPASDGQAELNTTATVERDAWFNDYESSGGVGGRQAGFVYSRIAALGDRMSTDTPVVGGDRVVDGVHDDPLFGGAGARTGLSFAGASWPNVTALRILIDGSQVGPESQQVPVGTQLDITVVGRDHDSSSDLTLGFDQDRNPYNGFDPLPSAEFTHGVGSAYFDQDYAWDTGTMSEGASGWVMASVTDGNRTRYLYSTVELTFGAGLIFSDGFESGLSDWSQVVGEGAR